jgi:hypothetical protein
MSKSILTGREMLRCIYDRYVSSFPVKGLDMGKAMVAIDLRVAAEKPGRVSMSYLAISTTLLTINIGTKPETTPLCTIHTKVGELRHTINLPYPAAILAGQDQEHSKFFWSLGVSLVALALSVDAIIAH